MGTHNQNLVRGSDNTYALGTTSARWKDLFLRAGAKLYSAAAMIWELASQGVTRSRYEGVATLTPTATGDPDNIVINIPALTDNTWIVQLTGGGGLAYDDTTTPDPITYNIYATWYSPYPLRSLNYDAFTAYVTFTAYDEATNRQVGSWNNWNQMVADLHLEESTIDDNLAKVHWLVRWPK